MEELPLFEFTDPDAAQATAKTKRQPPANIPLRPAKEKKKKQPTYEQVYADDELTWLEAQHCVFDGSNITRDAKIKGSLVGLAYGDVLGCPIEGYRWWNIIASYGPEEGLAFAKRKSGQIMPETDEDYLILKQTYLTPPITYNFERLRAVGKFTAIRKLRPFGIHSDDTQQALALIGLVMTAFQANRNVPLADDWAGWLTRGHLTKAWRGIGRNFSTAVGRLIDGQKAEAAANFSTGIGAIMRIGPMGALYLNKDVNDLADAVFETTLVTHKSICPAAMAFAIALTVRHFIQGNSISNIIAELPDQIEAQENRFIAKETTENRWGMKKSVATDAHSVSMLLRNVLKKVSEINANKSISVDERLWAMRAVVSQEAKLYAETSKAVADDDEEEEEDKSSAPKAKIQAFHPNQNLFSLGGVHALAVALTEDLVDPHDTIMGVVKLGYDADTVGAICGSLLGARFGTSWIESKYIFGYDRLDKVADAIVNLNQDESYVVLGESRAEFMKEESLLTALESKCKKFYKDKNAPHNVGANIN